LHGLKRGRNTRAQLTAEARKFTVAKMLSMQGKRFSVQDAALKLNVAESTIHKDIKDLMQSWQEERVMLVEFDRQRMAYKLEQLMKECRTRLNALKRNPHQGSRWVEMEIKAIDRLCKLYGLYAPQSITINDKPRFSKEEKDAVVDAVLKSEFFASTINITPTAKRIEHGSGDRQPEA